MKPFILQHVLIILVLICTSLAHADIFVWIDEEGTRHFSNRTPPVQATGVLTFEEVPFDAQADLERREQERREQEEMAWREIAEREAALARQESLIDAAYQQVAAALRKAEAVLAERQRASSRHGDKLWRSYASGLCYSGCTKRRYYRTRGKGSHKKRYFTERRYRLKGHRYAKHRGAKHPPGRSPLSVSATSPRREIRGRYQSHDRPRIEWRSERSPRKAALLSRSVGGSRHTAARMSRSARGGGRAAHP